MRIGTTFRASASSDTVTVFHFAGDDERLHDLRDECQLCIAEQEFRSAEAKYDLVLEAYWKQKEVRAY